MPIAAICCLSLIVTDTRGSWRVSGIDDEGPAATKPFIGMSFRVVRATERCARCARGSRVSTQSRSIGLFTPSAPRSMTWRYVIVVLTSRCPSSSCTVRMSYPDSSKLVANECRIVCGPTRFVMPAARAACARAF